MDNGPLGVRCFTNENDSRYYPSRAAAGRSVPPHRPDPMKTLRLLVAAVLLAASPLALAADPPTFTIVAKDGGFEPAALEVPAGQKFRLEVKNEGVAAIEFESKELRQEKIIKPKGSATMNLGPLKAGTYRYVDEYKEATSKGTIVAK